MRIINHIELIAYTRVYEIVTMPQEKAPQRELHSPADGEDGRNYGSERGAKRGKEKQSSSDGSASGARQWKESGVENKPTVLVVSREQKSL